MVQGLQHQTLVSAMACDVTTREKCKKLEKIWLFHRNGPQGPSGWVWAVFRAQIRIEKCSFSGKPFLEFEN
jgi:hypothetical protein